MVRIFTLAVILFCLCCSKGEGIHLVPFVSETDTFSVGNTIESRDNNSRSSLRSILSTEPPSKLPSYKKGQIDPSDEPYFIRVKPFVAAHRLGRILNSTSSDPAFFKSVKSNLSDRSPPVCLA